MSLLPFFMENCRFAYEPEEVRPFYLLRLTKPTCKSPSCNTDGVIAGEDNFNCNVDVRQFTPEEITVKLIGDNMISVEGKHEEKQDEHGFISRHFIRKFKIPEGYDGENVKSKLSTDGVLSICVPKVSGTQEECREIPIIQTGKPMKVIADVEKKEEGIEP